MWILKPLEPGGETHYLLPAAFYVVGRKNCDVILSNDQSISRAHAQLTANEKTLSVKDTSKYGTFVNNSRLPENQPLSLKSGDNITFGVFHTKFRVEHHQIVVCSSCLDNSEKKLLSDALQSLGGRLVPSWTQDCTHLIMSSVKVTIKTICALLCGRLIVKPEYFSEFIKARQQRLPPPQAESFIPEIDEPSLNKEEVNLGPNPARGRLFHGKTFVFFNSKQLKRLSAAVSFGGGESQLLEEGSLPRPLLESPQSCVVDAASGSSQPLLPSSTAGWVDSVKRILHERGCRLITESEIGLAAIYVSCDKYCNPSIAFSDSDSVQSAVPRMLPTASLSQNVAIEETVLQSSSIDVTAYVGNTEPSQGLRVSETAGTETVGETPTKSHRSRVNALCESRPRAQQAGNGSTVANTMSPSFDNPNADSQWQKPGPKQPGARIGGVLPSNQMANNGTATFSQKLKSPQHSSPQKQATLTNFFQPVNKKRLRTDELSAVESEPKRPAQPNPSSAGTTTPAAPSVALPWQSKADARPSTQSCSGLDLFTRAPDAPGARSEGLSHPSHQARKRKELEEEENADDMDMEELESIMSLPMDEFDEPWSAPRAEQQAHPAGRHSVDKRTKTAAGAAEPAQAGVASKRPRVDQRVSTCAATKTTQSLGAEEGSSSAVRQKALATEDRQGLWARGRPEEEDLLAVKNEDVSMVVGPSEASGGADRGQPMEMLEKPLKEIQQNTVASEAEDDLPKRLVLVEFKSLTVTAPPRGKPREIQGPSSTKNFKCFRKVRGCSADGLPRVIRGGDLLAHNKGKNTELDEWLKDAAEEERQSRQDESLGDDLFRYNPSKLSKRK